MTFPRIEARHRYWAIHPPTHLCVQAIAIYLGAVKPPARQSTEGMLTLADLRAMFPAGVAASDVAG